jgi:hypothetical protein
VNRKYFKITGLMQNFAAIEALPCAIGSFRDSWPQKARHAGLPASKPQT